MANGFKGNGTTLESLNPSYGNLTWKVPMLQKRKLMRLGTVLAAL